MEGPSSPGGPETRSRLGDSEAETRIGSASSVRRIALTAGDVFGPYRIVRPLGRGGMGDVYEVRHGASDRRIALKILGQSFPSTDATERFLREGRLAATVSHPNSVYVYAVHSENDVPAIAMELVDGGTLADAIERDGPMSPARAVEVVLQLIAGLEAAQARGVLHRDIKPANCFLDASGAVKVGDYGLSMSTMAADETRLTMMGTFMGTPSFASPEQVKCADIDVRSDIYSVGATLYFLLTGRPPFAQSNVMQVLSAVLQDMPEPPTRHVPAVPEALSHVVLRCLQKNPSARFASYADLRDALAIPLAPASWRARTLAIVADLVALAPAMLAFGAVVPAGAWEPLWTFAGEFSIQFLYFLVAEHIWGASLGKRLAGLRVVASRGGPLGLARISVRTAAYMVAFSASDFASLFFGVSEDYTLTISVLITVALFSTATLASGRLGLHERLSGTRTIHPRTSSVAATRREPEIHRQSDAKPLEGTVGQFSLRARLWGRAEEAVDEAEDASLGRRVWVHRTPAGTPALPLVRQGLAREGRLRWLASEGTGEQRCDVYEAVEGGPLRQVEWEVARGWLAQMARELDRGLKDATLPAALGPDRVWVGTDGQVRLLEFPVHPMPDARLIEVRDAAAAQQLLSVVASAAISNDAGERMPLSARVVLGAIDAGRHATLEELPRLLAPEVAKTPTRLSPARRAAALALCALFPLAAMVSEATRFRAVRSDPEIEAFDQALRSLAAMEPSSVEAGSYAFRVGRAIGRATSRNRIQYSEAERRSFRLFVAVRFLDLIEDEKAWSTIEQSRRISSDRRRVLKRALDETYASASLAERQQVATASQNVNRLARAVDRRVPFWLEYAGAVQGGLWIAFLFNSVMSAIAAFVCRGPLFLRLLGFALLAGGRPVSRWRASWRSVVGSSPLVLAAVLLPVLAGAGFSRGMVLPAVAGASNILFLAGVAWTIWHPDRSIHDRLVGTRIVPF